MLFVFHEKVGNPPLPQRRQLCCPANSIVRAGVKSRGAGGFKSCFFLGQQQVLGPVQLGRNN